MKREVQLDLFDEQRAVVNKKGVFYQLELPFNNLGLRHHEKAIPKNFPRLYSHLGRVFPQYIGHSIPDLTYFDIETAGLRHTDQIVMISYSNGGVGRGGSVITQLARNPSEEAAMLEGFVSSLTPRAVLVSFNGVAFDSSRLAHRINDLGLGFSDHPIANRANPLPHIDLIRYFPRGTSLQVYERKSLGYIRKDDVSGKEIPALYSQFVYPSSRDRNLRQATAKRMGGAILHNCVDVATLEPMLLEVAKRELIKLGIDQN